MRQITNRLPCFKGENFITPYAREFFSTKKLYIETSQGTGMARQTIYGVTVKFKDPDITGPELSKLCETETEKDTYLKYLNDNY